MLISASTPTHMLRTPELPMRVLLLVHIFLWPRPYKNQIETKRNILRDLYWQVTAVIFSQIPRRQHLWREHANFDYFCVFAVVSVFLQFLDASTHLYMRVCSKSGN